MTNSRLLTAIALLVSIAACGGGEPRTGSPASPPAAQALAGTSIVLVHGAWMGEWAWADVVSRLEARGAQVTTVELPAHGADRGGPQDGTLDRYVAAVTAAIDSAGKPVVLVGHSMAGVVITQVAELHPEAIDRLIYVAAYVPKNGEALQALAGSDAASHVGPVLVIDGAAGVAKIPTASLPDVFCADCSATAQQTLTSNYRDEPLAAFGAPVKTSDAGWGSRPRFYVFTSDDHAVSPDLQQRMTRDVQWTGTATLASSHSPMLSHPGELADLITRLSTKSAR